MVRNVIFSVKEEGKYWLSRLQQLGPVVRSTLASACWTDDSNWPVYIVVILPMVETA
jgi:hypothetical protein